MKRTTKKLSGIGLELFLERFYAAHPSIGKQLAQKLAKESGKAFASVRVRRTAWHDWRRPRHAHITSAEQQGAEAHEAHEAAPSNTPIEPHSPARWPIKAGDDVQPAALEGAQPAPGHFDPYSIGLIPTYQREGPEGLLAKLAEINSADNLRKLARSQQISLPADLRSAEAALDDIRSAIVAAVGKRIADRRAAAG